MIAVNERNLASLLFDLRLFLQLLYIMDHKSDEILRILSREGRVANTELAERVALSPSACLRRVQEMERQGVIKGYRAVLDREQTGGGFACYVLVGLSDHSKGAQAGFERAIGAAREVRECHNVAGAHEYLLRVETADLQAYKHFHTEILGTIAGVHSITSLVVMGTSKDERA